MPENAAVIPATELRLLGQGGCGVYGCLTACSAGGRSVTRQSVPPNCPPVRYRVDGIQ
jgi:hypothetical protein